MAISANLKVAMSDCATIGSLRHPDVVVEADEPRLVRVEQVEVVSDMTSEAIDRAGGEQHEADQPRADEDEAPERLADATAGASSASDRRAGVVRQRLGRVGHGSVGSAAGRRGRVEVDRPPGRLGARPGGRGGGARGCPRGTRRRCPGGSSSASSSSASMSSPSVVRYLLPTGLAGGLASSA